MKPTIETARKILELAPLGLVYGVGKPEPGQMCIEALKCYLLGEPHSDNPTCSAEPDRVTAYRANDAAGWLDDQDRGRGMARIVVMQLGTAGTDRRPWLEKLREGTTRYVLPIAFRAVAWRLNSQAMSDAADRCEAEGTRESAVDAGKVAKKVHA